MKNILLITMVVTSFVWAGGKSVVYEVEGEKYEGYYVSTSKDAPLVIIIHDWDGLTDYELKRASMLSDLGYAVFAADMFGKGIRPEKIEERRKLTGELYANRDKMRTLLFAALAEAKKQGAGVTNAVVMGYCFGGTSVLEFARAGADLKAFISFHGGLSTPEGQNYAKTKGEIFVFHGTADKHISMDEFATLAKELEKTGVKHEMITYSRAPHAFSVFGSDRYREDADKRSWTRLVAYFDEILK